MTVSELLARGKTASIVTAVGVLVAVLLVYVLTPAAYYVEEAGRVRIYARALDGPVELWCPRFQVGADNIVLTDYYVNRQHVVNGQFEYVLLRGVRAVGAVTIDVPATPDAAAAVITIESRDHPIVPQAFIHMANSTVTWAFPVDGGELNFRAQWSGAVDSPRPPLQSVDYNGKAIPRRFTRLGVI